MELTETRTVDGVKQYRCEICGWVRGTLWDGTGYTKLICEHCGSTLDDDYLGNRAYEAGRVDAPAGKSISGEAGSVV